MARMGIDTRKKTKKITYRMVRTLKGVLVFILLLFVGLSIWIYNINREKGDSYEKRMLAQQSYVSDVMQYRRGDILDRNENKLATSVQVYNMILAPANILENKEYKNPTIQALKDVFGVKEEEVEKYLKEKADSKYVQMKSYKGLQKDKVQEFEKRAKKDKNIQGVWFEEDYQRQYPYSTVAADVIGFSESNNTASWGIEGFYNDELNVSYGRRYGYYDSELNLVRTVKPAVDGNTIISTIDVNVQGVTEDCMEEFQKETGSENMAVIVMNPKNGEVYAMASIPFYDLNDPRNLKVAFDEKEIAAMNEKTRLEELNKIWRNYCISDGYEPGSTFKPITVAAVLDEGKATEKSHFVCDGGQQVADRYIKCNNKYGHGDMTLALAIELSCNDVMMQLAGKLGRDSFYKYMGGFNFGRRTGIDLPGEGMGLTFAREDLGAAQLATSSFGQGQSMTMIQMAAAFSSIVNGGNYYTPHVVKEIRNESGAVVQSFDDMLVRKTITAQSSETLKQYLYKTVEEGTASPAKVSGYNVGGKTGTAEKYPRGNRNYLVSFIGFTPIDDPEVVVYVIIDEPHVEDQAHSTYATEFASKLMKKILPLLGVYADENAKESQDDGDIKLPSTNNHRDEEAPEGGYFDGDFPVAGATASPAPTEGADDTASSGDADPATAQDGDDTASSDAADGQSGDGTEPASNEGDETGAQEPTPEPTDTPEPQSQHSTTEFIN